MSKVPRVLTIAVCALMLAMAGASCGKKKGAATRALPPEKIAAIDEAIYSITDKHHAPGALVGVWEGDDALFLRFYGNASIEPTELMSEGLSFRIGSITKTFTAVLVLILADEGLISLEDPVSRFVEGVPDGDRITLRMLLNHTSGIFNYGVDAALNEAIAAEPHRVWQPRELVEAGISNPPYFPPGEGCMYSNTNYVLLGMVVEKVTGNSFEEELERRIIAPLGLRDTYMAKSPELGGEHVNGYGYDPESGELIDLTDYLDPSIVWAAGGMVSTLEDLRAWGRALGEGRLLRPTTFEAMFEGMNDLPYMTEFFGYPIKYGLGIMDFGGWLGHGGMQPGYTAAVFYLPEKQTTVVTFLNISDAEEPATPLFMQVAEILFPDITPWGGESDTGSR